MRLGSVLLVATSVVLSACGGGGGPVNSTPVPSPTLAPTPAPTPTPSPNTSLSDLHSNQVFATNAAAAHAVFDTATRQVTSGTTAPSTVQLSYDAATKSYTVATSAHTQTFAPGQALAEHLPGETRYAIDNGTQSELLTLVVTPYSSTKANQYVGMGYWQRNSVSGSTQDSTFDSFVYGFETPATAVPRTGNASYVTDAFGLVATPGKEPKAFSGGGLFDVDLFEGSFRTKIFVGEYSLASDTHGSGGNILFQAAGHLSSGNGFAGNISYTGFDGTVAGTLSGRFYGPNGEELGGSFSASNAAGASVTGSLTGQRDPSKPAVTQSLTHVVADAATTEHFAEFTSGTDTSLSPAFRGSIGYNQTDTGTVTVRPDGSLSIRLSAANGPETVLTNADRSAVQQPNFDSYDVITPADGLRPAASVHVDAYKPGDTNTELALTYASFGIWSEPYQNGSYSQIRKDFFVYGFRTPDWLLSGRTGTGTYEGLVYGATTTADGLLQDVGGTSRFNVDFGSQSFSGSLELNRRPATGGPQVALGTWTFADKLVAGQMQETALLRDGVAGIAPLQHNSINPHFYGPAGEEIAATFTIQKGYASDIGTTAITGATVATRR